MLKRLLIAFVIFFLTFGGAGAGDDSLELSISTLQNLAENGDDNAQYLLGLAYATGEGVQLDEGEAEKWFLRASSSDPYYAKMAGDIFNPIDMFEPRDMEKAILWYERAASGGYTAALVALGYIYRGEKGVAADPGKAFDYYSKAAETGDSFGHMEVGYMLLNGEGRPKDAPLARQHLLTAAKSGEEGAMHLLGEIYRDGLGVEADPREAERWFLKASKAGFFRSPLDLAEMYSKDRKVEALAWFLIAELWGNNNEAKWRSRALYLKLPAEDSQKAKEMAEALVKDLGQ